MQEQPNEKQCECGCGEPVALATKTSKRDGFVVGQPVRFIRGHNNRGERNPNWRGDAALYAAVHLWLSQNYSKLGRCEQCGVSGKTQYAFLRHPAAHTRRRQDYAELCPACHARLDRSCADRS